MRKIVHVSDLHFGKADMSVMESLIQAWKGLGPDLVVISGDITQRATKTEFAEAKKFLERLDEEGLPYFVIPGNHDITPMYRPLGRLIGAYKNYRTFISQQTELFYHDGEVAIASIDTVKKTHPVNGRISKAQITQVQEWFAQFPDATKIVVTHHPLHRNSNTRSTHFVCWKGKRAVRSLEESDIDLYLCGHDHRTAVSNTGPISVHAGTVSQRLKGEAPAFNLLTINAPRMTVEVYRWREGRGFESRQRRDFLSGKQKTLSPSTKKKRLSLSAQYVHSERLHSEKKA